MTRHLARAAVVLLMTATAVQSQPAPDQPAATAALAAEAAPAPTTPETAPATVVLVAGTLVPLRLLEAVGSDISAPGSHFRLEVTDDLYVDRQLVVPAGTIATGEVVHAAKSSRLGKAGELLISARFMTVGPHQVRLRSNLGDKGRSRDMVALYLNPFIRGHEVILPVGTELVAKTAADESFSAVESSATVH